MGTSGTQVEPKLVGDHPEQQKRLNRLVSKNPSLKSLIPETIHDAYGIGVTFASADTLISEEDFPDSCPYSWDELMAYTTQE